MASALYPKWVEGLMQHNTNTDLDNANLKVALVDTGTYTYSTAHDFYNDVSTAVVGTPVALTSGRSYTNGVFDAGDVTFTGVSGASVEAVVIYIDTGTASTSPLIAYIDGITLTPSGNDVLCKWNASGIFKMV